MTYFQSGFDLSLYTITLFPFNKLYFYAQEKQSAWLPELVSRGYGDLLPALASAVQATLTTIAAPEIHKYIQKTDMSAL